MEKTTNSILQQLNLNSQVFLEISAMKKKYLEYVLSYNSFDTYCCYCGHLNIILFFLIDKYAVVYDVDVLDDYLIKFIKYQKDINVKSSTINKRLNVLKRVFKYSNSLKRFDNIKSLREKYVTFNYLKRDEIHMLINYVNNSNLKVANKLMLFMFLETGLRRKELKFIEISNIDFNKRMIYLTFTKSGKPRYICYSYLTELYLKKYINLINGVKYLFEEISNVSIQSCFRRIQKQLKFKNFSCYVLRHSYATIIVDNDGNLEMLRQTMGHEKLTTTQRYIHYNTDLIKKSYDQFFKI